jgi:hypothetical protein
VSRNTKLEKLYCFENRLATLDVRRCWALQDLDGGESVAVRGYPRTRLYLLCGLGLLILCGVTALILIRRGRKKRTSSGKE